jgi:4-diphosphocytidyl-2-C-methyl-D-erythritol kinase
MKNDFAPFSIDTHTKVNIGLRILEKRLDGYHNLDTVFQELNFGDTLYFSPAEKFGFEIIGLAIDDQGDNICERAYYEFCEKTNLAPAVKIVLEKRVPTGSGLGGGSADAAGVLKGLNRLCDAPLSFEQLEEISGHLGADVAFFIRGETQRGQGIGERLSPMKLDFSAMALLVIPDLHISTKQAFEGLNLTLTPPREPFMFASLLKKADLTMFFDNVFETPVSHAYPQIGEIKQVLLERGAFFASLSGSGSTVYGLFDSGEEAFEASKYFASKNIFSTVSKLIISS